MECAHPVGGAREGARDGEVEVEGEASVPADRRGWSRGGVKRQVRRGKCKEVEEEGRAVRVPAERAEERERFVMTN